MSSTERALVLLRPVRRPHLLASILITVAVAADAARAWAVWHAYGVVDDYLMGDGGTDLDAVTAADRLTIEVSIAHYGVIIAAGVAFVVWLRNARANADEIHIGAPTYGRGWAVGSWICPVANLWIPFRVVLEVYRASDPRTDPSARSLSPGRTEPILVFWWATWLATFLVGRGVAASLAASEPGLELLHQAAVAETVMLVLEAAAAYLIIRATARVTRWQRAVGSEV